MDPCGTPHVIILVSEETPLCVSVSVIQIAFKSSRNISTYSIMVQLSNRYVITYIIHRFGHSQAKQKVIVIHWYHCIWSELITCHMRCFIHVQKVTFYYSCVQSNFDNHLLSAHFQPNYSTNGKFFIQHVNAVDAWITKGLLLLPAPYPVWD